MLLQLPQQLNLRIKLYLIHHCSRALWHIVEIAIEMYHQHI
jgi:hypothetical protein